MSQDVSIFCGVLDNEYAIYVLCWLHDKTQKICKTTKNNLTTQQNICNIINVRCNKDTAM